MPYGGNKPKPLAALTDEQKAVMARLRWHGLEALAKLEQPLPESDPRHHSHWPKGGTVKIRRPKPITTTNV